MTGFAQLRVHRELSWREKLAHDLEYIADRSVGLYIEVVIATLRRLMAGRSAPERAL
jgi:lipopolysaccharide/colanic/teichoic acid biosynthesis glycosyltransferase